MARHGTAGKLHRIKTRRRVIALPKWQKMPRGFSLEHGKLPLSLARADVSSGIRVQRLEWVT
jgi:hypothetical protein